MRPYIVIDECLAMRSTWLIRPDKISRPPSVSYLNTATFCPGLIPIAHAIIRRAARSPDRHLPSAWQSSVQWPSELVYVPELVVHTYLKQLVEVMPFIYQRAGAGPQM